MTVENVKMELCELGKSGIMAPVMGVGTMLWSPSKSLPEEQILKTYSACIDKGLNFFDTAEIYANGKAEEMLGKCIKKDGRPVMIASKFAPPSSMIPQRPKRTTVSGDSPRALIEALDGSLSRMGIDYIDLYQMHAPPSKNTITEYMELMAESVRAEKVRAVGVCNFSEKQMREAHAALAKHNISLATSMVGYNLIRRWPETNGIFSVCKELGVTLIPYSPLSEGVLTGKYRGKKKLALGYAAALYFGHLNITKERADSVPFIRRLLSKPRELNKKKLEPVFRVMDEIANAHGKTFAQVAINWLLTTEDVSILPIPGMKNVLQVNDNIGALDWKITKEERMCINKAELESR